MMIEAERNNCRGTKTAAASSVTAAKAAQGKEKAAMQQLRDGDWVEELDWAEVREKMFKVSRMQGNPADGLHEVNRSIRQVLTQMSGGLFPGGGASNGQREELSLEVEPKEAETEATPGTAAQETTQEGESAAAACAPRSAETASRTTTVARESRQIDGLLPTPSKQEVAAARKGSRRWLGGGDKANGWLVKDGSRGDYPGGGYPSYGTARREEGPMGRQLELEQSREGKEMAR
ncbi:unnamed protein product [Linum tenue]|uniref:Uncharacterized protein n=1 Tax=Linum tenue TaxID=586396 RepID=A0AAV0R839_9ROSI|nr:unnamed protein product [Linum tenue]